MYQIDDNTAAATLPALPTDNVGSPGFFTGGNPTTSTPATRVRFWWLNMIQTEMLNVVLGAGIAMLKPNNAQLNQAFRRYAAASFTAIALTGALTADQAGEISATAPSGNVTITLPAANSCGPGVPVRFLVKRPASDVATYSVNVLPAGSDLYQDGGLNAAAVALGSNPCLLMRGELLELWSDGVSNWYGFYSSKIRSGSFGASGTYGTTGTTMFRVPPFITLAKVELWGGGGGGGATPSSPSAASAGGGAGYARGAYPVTPGTLIAVTAGAAGVGGGAGTSNPGTAGGSSSFGSLCTVTGGGAGTGAGAGGYQNTSVGAGGTASGGTIVNATGTPGSIGANIGSIGYSGAGGSNFAASGGPSAAGGGLSGSTIGGGGGGGANGGGGGNGGIGLVLLELV